MTETEWLTATDPQPMLEFLRGKASDRKLRLFAVACFDRLAAYLPDPWQQRAINVLEQIAEGRLIDAECRGIVAKVRQAIPPDEWATGSPPGADHLHFIALMLYREFCSKSIAHHAVAAAGGLADGVKEQPEQLNLLRCIIGNPFRPVAFDPVCRTETAVALATAIYAERAFDRMPILADALQDAGCDHDDILSHCRGEGPHARGCWVVDLVLGKS
jgi:hypothetical protein